MNNNKEICILNDYTIYAETNYFIVVTYTGKINLYDVPDKNIGMPDLVKKDFITSDAKTIK